MSIVDEQDVVEISCDFCDMSFYVDEENQDAIKVCPYCEVFLESGLVDSDDDDDDAKKDVDGLLEEFDLFNDEDDD